MIVLPVRKTVVAGSLHHKIRTRNSASGCLEKALVSHSGSVGVMGVSPHRKEITSGERDIAKKKKGEIVYRDSCNHR